MLSDYKILSFVLSFIPAYIRIIKFKLYCYEMEMTTPTCRAF